MMGTDELQKNDRYILLFFSAVFFSPTIVTVLSVASKQIPTKKKKKKMFGVHVPSLPPNTHD